MTAPSGVPKLLDIGAITIRLGRVKLPNCKGLNRWGYLFEDEFEDKQGTLYKTNDLLVNGFYTGCWVLSNMLAFNGVTLRLG